MKMRLTAFLMFVAILTSLTASATPPPPDNYQMSTPSYQLQNEEQVWFCPTDSNILVANWRDFRFGYRQIGVGRSILGGDFWTDSLVSIDFQKFDRQSDPTLTVDVNGNFYMSYLDYQSTVLTQDDSSYITFIVSTDKGATWIGPYTVEQGLGPYFEDKQFITADRSATSPYLGNVYVAWARFPNPNKIMFARSTNGAQSFDLPVVVGPVTSFSYPCGSGSIEGGQFANPFVGADGSVYVTWTAVGISDTINCFGDYCLKLVKSTDGGVTFTTPSIIRFTYGNWGFVDGGIDVYNEPAAVGDVTGGPFGGSLYIEYANQDTSNHIYDDYNIEFIRSTDGGANWSEPIYVNDDYTGPGAMFDQFHPWLFINEEGVLLTIFYDQRTDPNHYNFDVFAAYSFDGGESFTTNHRISDVSINPGLLAKAVIAQEGNPNPMNLTLSPMAGKIAEYIGVTAFYDKVTAVWTDTRMGNQDVFGANWHIPLLDPRLLSPIQGDTVTTGLPTLRWATGWKNSDDRYRIEIASDSHFGTILYSGVSDTTFVTLTSPDLGSGYYFWRAKGFKISSGDSSDYAIPQIFYVNKFICGDANANGTVNIIDVSYIINYLYRSGPAPIPPQSADVNSSGGTNIIDVSYLINFLYRSGPAPNCPTL